MTNEEKLAYTADELDVIASRLDPSGVTADLVGVAQARQALRHLAAHKRAQPASAEDAEILNRPMSLRVALDFADNPRPYHSLACPADTNGELYRALKALATAHREAAAQPASVADVAAAKRAIEARNRHLFLHPGDAVGAMMAALRAAAPQPPAKENDQ